MKSCFIVLTVWISSTVYSQKYSESERLNFIQNKGIEISNIDMKNLNESDFDLIINYNFDQYRNEKTDRQVQLVRGPIATVKSFSFCKENQISFNERILQSKKNEIQNKSIRSVITQVNIGLGYRQNELKPENY